MFMFIGAIAGIAGKALSGVAGKAISGIAGKAISSVAGEALSGALDKKSEGAGQADKASFSSALDDDKGDLLKEIKDLVGKITGKESEGEGGGLPGLPGLPKPPSPEKLIGAIGSLFGGEKESDDANPVEKLKGKVQEAQQSGVVLPPQLQKDIAGILGGLQQ